jgi:hypothetical protein
VAGPTGPPARLGNRPPRETGVPKGSMTGDQPQLSGAAATAPQALEPALHMPLVAARRSGSRQVEQTRDCPG